jgi:hypothetical protein
MTVTSYKMGPGTLKLGTGGTMDASCQVTSCRVSASENVDATDAIDVLCGEQVPPDETVTTEWTITGTFLQDIAAAGVVAYTWTNKRTWVDFEFIPNTAAARKVTGQCRLIPLDLGGDAKARPTSDFTWAARGPAAATDPVFAAAP